MLTETQARIVLNGLTGVGPVTVRRLLETHSTPQAILEAATAGQALDVSFSIGEVLKNWPKHFNLKAAEQMIQKFSAQFVVPSDDCYPALLREIPSPPTGLYARGHLTNCDKAVAIVGTRQPTLYGETMARKLAEGLVQYGYTIVSGMARGIDTAAHEGALNAGGHTVAVLGCGLDVIYPPENKTLYEKITAHGALVTEFGFGRHVDKITFPMRNRIISGICQSLIVVESDVNGGSMLTANFAADQGRLVFALPGRVDQNTSRGCHKLIREGAILVTCLDDILEEFRHQPLLPHTLPISPSNMTPREMLTEVEKNIMLQFESDPVQTIDTLVERTRLSVSEINAHLLMLELKKHVAKRPDGSIEKTG